MMDSIFALLRRPAPTNEEISQLEEEIPYIKQLWRDNKYLSITPKAHILFSHALAQYKCFGGVADKVEDFVEKSHQQGKRLQHLTARMHSKSYQQQQILEIGRTWISTAPAVQEQSNKVRTLSKRSFRTVRKECNPQLQKKSRSIKRENMKSEAFYEKLRSGS